MREDTKVKNTMKDQRIRETLVLVLLAGLIFGARWLYVGSKKDHGQKSVAPAGEEVIQPTEIQFWLNLAKTPQEEVLVNEVKILVAIDLAIRMESSLVEVWSYCYRPGSETDDAMYGDGFGEAVADRMRARVIERGGPVVKVMAQVGGCQGLPVSPSADEIKMHNRISMKIFPQGK